MLLLLLTGALGLASRLIFINFPEAISFEEASRGYLAKSIALLGKDDHNLKFPLLFRSVGNYPLALPIYSTVPFIQIFGLNNLGARTPGVFFGSLTVPIFFLLSSLLCSRLPFLSKKEKTILPFWATLYLCFSPWHVFISRNNLPLTESLFFSLTALLLLLRSQITKKTIPFVLSVIFLSFALLSSYYSWFPLFLFSMTFLWLGRAKPRRLFFLLIPFLIIGLLVTVNQEYRLFLRNNFIDKEPFILWDIGPRRSYDVEIGWRVLARPLHNKLSFFFEHLGKKYTRYYDWELLASPSIAGFTEHLKRLPKIFFWEIPLFFFGIWWFLKKGSRTKEIVLILIIMPFETLFWRKDFLKNEMLFFLPVFIFFLTLGLVKLAEKIRWSRLLLILIIPGLTILYSLGILAVIKTYLADDTWSESRNEAYFWLFKKLNKIENNYSAIVITDLLGQPPAFALFYQDFPPEKYLTTKKEIGLDQDYLTKIVSYDKFQFSSLRGIEDKLPGVLYIGLREEFVDKDNPAEIASFQPLVKESFTFSQDNPKQDNTLWFYSPPYKPSSEKDDKPKN